MIDPHEIHAIKALWLAVIRQAIEDHALWREIQSGRKKNGSNVQDIIFRGGYSWIEEAGPDFRGVCALADVNHLEVQTAARRMTLKEIQAPCRVAKERRERSGPKRPRGRLRLKR